MMEIYEDESFVQHLDESASELEFQIRSSSIPDSEPIGRICDVYHKIGKRGDHDGEYFIRTTTTFDPQSELDIEPVAISQTFGIEKDGEEYTFIHFDYAPGEDNSLYLEVANTAIPYLDYSFEIRDFDGYSELFGIIQDVKSGRTDREMLKDEERMFLLVKEAESTSVDSMPRSVQSRYILNSDTGCCDINSIHALDGTHRVVNSADYILAQASHAEIHTEGSKSKAILKPGQTALSGLVNFVRAREDVAVCLYT